MSAQAASNDFIVAPNGGDISGAALSAQLAQGNVTLQSSQGANSGSGNLIIDDVVTWSANTTLTLEASNNVIINTNISASGDTAGLVISPATANGGEPPNATGAYGLNGASITLSGAAPSLSIAGTTYIVINSLGAATDATTPPASPTLQGVAATANLAKNFALGSDIDATASATWNSGAGFTPIGEHGANPLSPPVNPFSGVFDGLGHKIGTLTILLPGRTFGVGLFGATGSGSTVQNLRLVDANVTGQHFVGGLAGENSGIIAQCSANGVMTGVNNTGGLVGYSTALGTITSSYAEGTVSTNTNGIHVGGLAGCSMGILRNSYATANVRGNGIKVGGLVGSNGSIYVPNAGTRVIENCYASGSVSGATDVGGLAGYNASGTINTSYWNTETSGQSTSAGGTGLTTAQMKTQSSFTGFDFPGTWIILEGVTFPLLWYEYSTTIYNVLQLQLMATNLNASYTLGADIDASATSSGKSIWGSTGFLPVGTATTPFTGTLDGKGHTIGNLMINAPASDNVGLFGYTGAASAIRNVGMLNSTVTGQNNVGALSGYNRGSISNSYSEQANVTGMGGSSSGSGGLAGINGGTIGSCHATGSVTGIDDVGGLVGVNSGQVNGSNSHVTVTNATGQAGGLVGTNAQEGNISASHASGVVGDVGISGEMGGLVGLNSGSISYSNALGRVDCGNNSSCGGLVGNNGGTISNSYATGGVSGTGTSVGGLVGINAQGAIATTYATGTVVGLTNVGGLVGNNNGTISNAYWNSGLVQTGIGAGTTTGATELTAAQMLLSSSFSNFTITTTPGAQGWVVVNTDGSLQTAASTAAAATSPLLATEYSTAIDNAHQLQLMLMNLGASYSLIADLDASGTGNGREVWGTLGFVPIRIGNTNTPFTGIFDGQRHKISELNINRTDNNVGLFGYTSNATIRNVGLTGGRLSGNNNVGALVGYNDSSRVSNSYANAYVSGTVSIQKVGFGEAIGVLVGYNNGNIDHSYAEGISYGRVYVGGLVGDNSGTINSSAARTNVNARANLTGANSGGLVGYNSGRISNSYTTGNVISKKGLGGLVGTNSFGTISNSYARTGLLSSPSTKDIGGLIGINAGTIDNSYWDITTSGQTGSAGGNGLSDDQMRQQSSFSGWDFADTWEMQTYPALRNMPEGYAP